MRAPPEIRVSYPSSKIASLEAAVAGHIGHVHELEGMMGLKGAPKEGIKLLKHELAAAKLKMDTAETALAYERAEGLAAQSRRKAPDCGETLSVGCYRQWFPMVQLGPGSAGAQKLPVRQAVCEQNTRQNCCPDEPAPLPRCSQWLGLDKALLLRAYTAIGPDGLGLV
jgi:hypothetical protein